MLPHAIRDHLRSILNTPVQDTRPCSGGEINNAVQIRTADETYFLKWNASADVGMFTAEAKGLRLLAAAEALPLPAVLHVQEATDDIPAYLLLEWFATGQSSADTMPRLGEGLARLHHVQAAQHGLDHDNFIGSLPQSNQQHDNWVTFYAQQRIAVQRDIAAERGRLSDNRARRLNELIERMPEFVPPDATPSLLHGDLWGGNVMTLDGGQPALIDPAVYYGHFEVELAFTELFGGFSGAFYDGYWANSSVDKSGYAERRPLYQLYPLLVHLNIFGGGYARSVDAILDRYVD